MKWRKLPAYILGQFFGAFLAGLTLYLFFAPSISNYENVNGTSVELSNPLVLQKCLENIYINSGSSAIVTLPIAMGAEAFGTFILVILIFALTEGAILVAR
jgi:glycerol uptake facilitator protein